jgi:hypothetical protein
MPKQLLGHKNGCLHWFDVSSCDCTILDTCWIITFDIEFLSVVFWETGGAIGTEWIPYTGNKVIWVDVSDQTNSSLTCDDGVATDILNPGPAGWDIIIPGAFNAWGKVEAGNCEEGIAMYLQSDFATIPDGFSVSLPTTSGSITISFEEDLSGATPPGAVNQEVIRGTITLSVVYPSEKGACGCP